MQLQLSAGGASPCMALGCEPLRLIRGGFLVFWGMSGLGTPNRSIVEDSLQNPCPLKGLEGMQGSEGF